MLGGSSPFKMRRSALENQKGKEGGCEGPPPDGQSTEKLLMRIIRLRSAG
jgi:hypothetical protein